jgi:asparagine synthetase B (glutamine-hydrolysing)
MIAFGCILDRHGEMVPSYQLERLSEPLAGYGRHSSSVCQGPVGIVVRHSNETGSHERYGPFQDHESGLIIAVAGRFRLVNQGSGGGDSAARGPEHVGYAKWALNRWIRHGPSFLGDIAGSFTLVAADPSACWMNVVRGHLGDLKVYYHLTEQRLVSASEPSAILRDPSVSGDLDERSIAAFLGFRHEQTERSFFRRVSELSPAHRLQVNTEGSQIEHYWRFRRLQDIGKITPQEIESLFVEQLKTSTHHHLEGLEPAEVGLSLSGGMDSTTLAALAPPGIRAFSWYFDETSDGGERSNIEAVARHLKLPVHWLNGDGFYPLCNEFSARFVHENSPYVNAFAELKRQLYASARAEGCRRIMVGDGGDVLFAADGYWLRDALMSGKQWAWPGLVATIGKAVWGDGPSRHALRRLLPLRGVRHKLGWRKPPWLTAEGYSLQPPEQLAPILPDSGFKYRYDLSVGSKHIELESEERRLFAQCGVERANPFWHWPLLEMVLSLPAYWYRRDGRSKILSRQAMRGYLPEEVLESGRVGLLGDYFLRGIELNGQDIMEQVFRHPRSDWPRYVNRSWLEPYLSATETIDFGHTILWRVICYELWVRHLIDRR